MSGLTVRRVVRAADIAGEAILLACAGRAILMQIALPPVGAGVAAHSDFAGRPMSRLKATLTYSYAAVLGNAADRAAVRTLVDRAHGPVHASGTGVAGADDTVAYNAFDPDLQRWVAVTLYDSAVVAFESVFGPLDPAGAEAVLAGFAPLGTCLQVPADRWPADLAAYRAYRDATVARLEVTDRARRVAHAVLHPVTPWYLRAAAPLIGLLTAGYLDPTLRAAYDLPWDDRRQRRFDRLIAGLRVVYPRLPRRLRWWPCLHYLGQLRRGAATTVAFGRASGDP